MWLLVAVGLPQATVQNLRRSIMHLLPAMEAATLAQRADGIGERMMDLRFKRLCCCKLTRLNSKDGGKGKGTLFCLLFSFAFSLSLGVLSV